MGLKVLKSFNRKSYNVDITNKDIGTILGNSSKLVNWYKDGKLDTLMLVGHKDNFTLAMGTSCSKPVKLVALFRLVAKATNIDNKDLSSMYISYTSEGSFSIQAFCGGIEPLVISFQEIEGELHLDVGDALLIEERYHTLLIKKLSDVIMWANSIMPKPLYSIGYYFSSDNNTLDTLGKGKFYSGISEASKENGVDLTSLIGSNETKVEGEYALVFLEN